MDTNIDIIEKRYIEYRSESISRSILYIYILADDLGLLSDIDFGIPQDYDTFLYFFSYRYKKWVLIRYFKEMKVSLEFVSVREVIEIMLNDVESPTSIYKICISDKSDLIHSRTKNIGKNIV